MEVEIIFYIDNVLNLFSLEKEMAAHSSILAWRTPWTEEPGGLQSMGLQRVRHDCANTHTHTHKFVYHMFEYVCIALLFLAGMLWNEK